MLRSLRFQLPALSIAGILLAGLVATLVAFPLYQRYSERQALDDLRREASGVAGLYSDQAEQFWGRGKSGDILGFSAQKLEDATGNEIYYMGLPAFGGQLAGFRELKPPPVEWKSGTTREFKFTPPDSDQTYIGASAPLRLGPTVFGALVVARPVSDLRSGWTALVARLALAFAIGGALAGLISWRVSRRLTKPVLALSSATDEISAGRYDVVLPERGAHSEIVHLADRFREMAAKLSEAETLERNFLMSVSHDLRTPLTAIRGHALALSEGLADDPEARALSLAMIANETARLERLVGDILDLAKLGARRFTVMREEVDMGRLFEHAYAGFAEEARRRNIEFRQEAHAQPVVETDGDRVLQIITNLLSNAFHWTPNGGSVTLAMDGEDGWVSVTVADTGAGIPLDEQDKIFRPFFSRDGGGTGLGLAIAQELAQALGGRIELESAPGQGSRFTLRLPVGSVEPAVVVVGAE